MRTLIVGGGGFIGLNIAQARLRAGRATVLFDRAVPPQALTELRAIGPACTVVTGDVRDATQIAAAFAGGIDSVVYGAAVTADRASMATERAGRDPGFTAAWGMQASATHYADWMRSHPWCFEAHKEGSVP